METLTAKQMIRKLFTHCSCGAKGTVKTMNPYHGVKHHNLQVVCSNCDSTVDHRSPADKKLISDAIVEYRKLVEANE